MSPDWNMGYLSDGQRRRVQIVLGLMAPWDVLLLDEVTVDLDVLVRADLLRFLARETRERGATILYATHIFDGLAGWPTHVAHMAHGEVRAVREMADFPEFHAARAERLQAAGVAPSATSTADTKLPDVADLSALDSSPLLMVVERWLRADQAREREQVGVATGGPEDPRRRTRWEALSEAMAAHGDKYYNYWR